MDSPDQSNGSGIKPGIDCSSTYGLLMGMALALMKIRWGAGLIR
jgi:hypothetical protein